MCICGAKGHGLVMSFSESVVYSTSNYSKMSECCWQASQACQHGQVYVSVRGRWEELTVGVTKWVWTAARDTGGYGSLHHETAGECVVLVYFFLFEGCPVFFFLCSVIMIQLPALLKVECWCHLVVLGHSQE